jgi:hypothetical protein
VAAWKAIEIIFRSVLHFQTHPKKFINWPLDSSTAQCMYTVTPSRLVSQYKFSSLSRTVSSLLAYSMSLKVYTVLIMDYNDVNVSKYNADSRNCSSRKWDIKPVINRQVKFPEYLKNKCFVKTYQCNSGPRATCLSQWCHQDLVISSKGRILNSYKHFK